jgi:hypothetical protein
MGDDRSDHRWPSTGLMLLVGAEINSEIEAATAEKRSLGLPRPPRRGFSDVTAL